MNKIALVKVLLTVFLGAVGWSQPLNDHCNSSDTLCPSVSLHGSTENATVTVCPNCEDDFTFCFTPSASVWYIFKSNNSGGAVTVQLSNVTFNGGPSEGTALNASIVSYLVGCDAATYTSIGNCELNQTSNTFSLNATGLLPNTYYAVVIDGAKNGGATIPAKAEFDIVISGSGVDRNNVLMSIQQPSGEVCPSEPLAFVVYTSNCQDSSLYSWYVNGVLQSTTLDNFWLVSNLTNGDVVSVSCTCYLSCPITLNATGTPLIMNDLYLNAGADIYSESGEAVQLTASSNGTSFNWEPISEVSSPYTMSTIVSPVSTTTYTVTATNSVCSLTDNVTVFITNEMTIPGSFSPNGDGINDHWLIPGIEFFPNAQMKIYSRWGQVVAEITGYSASKNWDGTYLGKPVPDGTYFYVLDRSNGDEETLKGTVTIIR